jgi:hypothetical protein
LPVLTGCAPIYDEIARRASNFIIDAVSSDSSVVRFMANHALNSAKARSVIGRNAILCCLRYGWTFQQFFACKRKRNFIDSQSRSQLKDNDYLFLKSAMEVLMIRDGVLTIPKQSWSRMDLKECLRMVSSDSRVYI